MNGQIANSQTVDAVLSGLAQAYSNGSMVSESLFPIVSGIEKESVKIPKFGKEHFRLASTNRALRAKSNQLSWQFKDPLTVPMEEHDLVFPMDTREIQNVADVVNLEQYGVNVTAEALALTREYAAATLAQDAANYASGNSVEITSSTSKWSHANATPIKNIKDAKIVVRGLIAKDPNIAVFGSAAWEAFCEHASVIERIKYSQMGVITEEIAAKLIGVDQVVVGKGIYVDADGTPQMIWGDVCILAYVPTTPPEQRNIYEPAFGYTLMKKGYPNVDRYGTEGDKIQNLRQTNIYGLTLCGSDAGYLIWNVL